MVFVLYFICNFDVVLQGGEPCLPMLPSRPEVFPHITFDSTVGPSHLWINQPQLKNSILAHSWKSIVLNAKYCFPSTVGLVPRCKALKYEGPMYLL